MMEDNFEITIDGSSAINKRMQMIEQLNKSLNELRDTLIANFGTSDINTAMTIAEAITAGIVGIHIVEMILTLGGSEVFNLAEAPEGDVESWNIEVFPTLVEGADTGPQAEWDAWISSRGGFTTEVGIPAEVTQQSRLGGS